MDELHNSTPLDALVDGGMMTMMTLRLAVRGGIV